MGRHLVAITILAACEHGQTPPGDDVPPDSPTGCVPELLVVGALFDWDASLAAPAGVPDASISQVGHPQVTTTTPADGRFALCASPADPFSFTIETSEAHLGGTLTIAPASAVTSAFVPLELRTVTVARAATFFAEQGLTFDPDAAQVVVFQAADRLTLTLSGSHDPPRQADLDTDGLPVWSAGATGRYVLFPNVTPASSVQLGGDPQTLRPIPAPAGQISLVVTSFILE